MLRANKALHKRTRQEKQFASKQTPIEKFYYRLDQFRKKFQSVIQVENFTKSQSQKFINETQWFAEYRRDIKELLKEE